MAVATFPTDHIESDVSSPREVRSTDVSRLRAQAGTIVAIVVAAIGIVLYMERRYSDLEKRSSELQHSINGVSQRLDSQKENIDLKLQIMKLEFEKGELRKALLAELKETP